jgi:sortase A
MTAVDRARWLLRGIGQTFITAGLVILLFCVYELYVTNLYTAREQKQLGQALDEAWDKPLPVVDSKPVLPPYRTGEGIGRIFLPSIGKDEMHVVVEGVGLDVLKKGPGHYPGTAVPGAVGNTVISGHRTTYGGPFNRLDEVKVGDRIVVETQLSFFTYTVSQNFIVPPSAIGETYKVPNQPGVKPTKALLTLTTCHPKYSARQRLIVRAVLESTLAKRPGVVPPALEG